MAKTKKKTAKAKRKAETKKVMRMQKDRRAPKAKAKKEKSPKPPKPTLFEQIGPSPIKMDKPEKLTIDFLEDDLDCCHSGLVWVKAFCPRGFPMDEKKMIEVMMKPGASITFEASWPSWVLHSFISKAMNSEQTTSQTYEPIRAHCALVIRSFQKEERERLSRGRKLLAAQIGSARDMYIDTLRILIKHYNKL